MRTRRTFVDHVLYTSEVTVVSKTTPGGRNVKRTY